ncbi:MAG: tat pathway signal sequence domain protein [Hyphomicrobiales bacterium]|nr:tat pathway signal sequence domain protein [Hyphomicrobiales bacterium]MBV9430227.1 tat pathway signal sequence domain protein [Hyphomicrobiales bacterium]MBV9738420.1 tat pathway signal sequence domain protein [Hyphomicrobiales bacterium]
MLNMRNLMLLGFIGMMSLGAATDGLAAGPQINATITGLALRGYDPVAYFTDGKPVLGDFSITAQYEGATYRFASEEHKALFMKEPAKYLPQFGGFCAYGAAAGYKVDGDPTLWKIVDNKLYLNIAPPVAARWNQDVAGYIKAANEKWTAIKDKAPSDLQK